MRPAGPEEKHPALVLLSLARWDTAAGWLHGQSAEVAPRHRLDQFLAEFGDRERMRETVLQVADALYELGTPDAGARALAWLMLAVDPRKPESFWPVLAQIQWILDTIEGADPDAVADLRARLRIWWRAAEGEWKESGVSIFRIADRETLAAADDLVEKPEVWKTRPPVGPHLVVMPKAKASKLNNHHTAYKEIVDAPLPLIPVRDLAKLRGALHAEFPHANAAVDLLLRDLRDGKPFWIRPVVLVGPAGAGKSRLVRRLIDLVARDLYLYRFDAGSSTDGHFAGTSKGWGNTEASVPLRAIAQSRTANPVVLLDEIDKAASSTLNGQLSHALLAFLDRETSARYRDQSLDAEVDLSAVSYIATANDPTRISGPLRDRFRMITVPAPMLAHLPALAASVMTDLAIEDEARSHDAPLAADELAVIGRAWRRAGLSMRGLQKIVRATLDARDQTALRH